MPDIGATLREARMRAHIDISEIEAQTKIRAKYLRALENEEWDLLPGPTFVKTFLRTYAEALGLDARLLVEEYKLRHERLSDSELRPIGPPGSRGPSGRGRGGGRGRGPSNAVIAAMALLVVVLAVLALTRDDDSDTPTAASVPRTQARPPTRSGASTGTAPTAKRSHRRRRRKPVSKVVSLRVIPTAQVNVCLYAAGQGVLIGGANVAPGAPLKTYRSTRFSIKLANSSVKLAVNGQTRPVAKTAGPFGYVITRAGRTRLKRSDLPTCGQ